MHLYSKLTDEQIKICNKNNQKARRGFKRNGFMPDSNKTYDLHHIDSSLRYNDVERYIQGNIEDLVCIEHSQHAKLHNHFKSLDRDRRSKITKEMGADPNFYGNSEEYRQKVSEEVKERGKDPDSVYNTIDYRKKIGKAVSESGTEERRDKQSKRNKAYGADPNFIGNSAEYRKNIGKNHMKKVVITNNIEILEFPNEFECGLFLGYPTKEKATNMVGGMIKKKGYVTKRDSPYNGWEIKIKD